MPILCKRRGLFISSPNKKRMNIPKNKSTKEAGKEDTYEASSC